MVNTAMFSAAGPWSYFPISSNTPMIKSKPAVLPPTSHLTAFLFHSQLDSHISIYSVQKSRERATLRLPLYIIIGIVRQIHLYHRPGPSVRLPCLFAIESRWAAWGSGSSVPRPAVCVRASSHTPSNSEKEKVCYHLNLLLPV